MCQTLLRSSDFQKNLKIGWASEEKTSTKDPTSNKSKTNNKIG